MKRKVIITEEIITVQEIAARIHRWIWDMGDKINHYNLGVDRVGTIAEVVRSQ